MSDFDTDIDILDDDSTDLESVDNDNTTASDYSISEVDAVADLLMGGDGTGHTPKANDTGMRSRDVDAHGNVDWSSSSKEQEAPAYISNQSMPDMQSTQGRIAHVDAQSQKVMREWEDLNAMQQDLPPEVFAERQQYLQGQAAGLTIQRQQAQIEQMQNAAWVADQEQRVIAQHADIWNDPAKKAHYQKEVINFLGNEMGFSSSEMENIDAREMNAAISHIKVREERDRLKIENAKLKQAHRQRQKSLKQGRRDIETGAGRSKKGGGDVYDEVARILGGVK